MDPAISCSIMTDSGASVNGKCLSILKCRPDMAHINGLDASYQCIGGQLDDNNIACSLGYKGQLCGTCEESFGREHGNICVSCDDATDPWKIFTWVLIAGGVVAVGWLAVIMAHHRLRVIHPGGEVAVDDDGLFENLNPLSSIDDDQPVGHGHSHGAQKAKTPLELAGAMARSLVFVGLQPAKIAITYMQIASLLGAVLHFTFPPLLSAALGVFKPLIAVRG